MADNNVTVTQQWPGGEGNFLFAAQGTYMDSASLAVVTPVVSGQLDPTGLLTASILASDNYPDGCLLWYIHVTVGNFPNIEAPNVPVNFSNGASQGLFGILTSIGYNFIEV
jgi:hypothetical protein